MILDYLYQMVNDLNKTTSNNEKIAILKKYDSPETRRILKYTYDTLTFVYGVTSKSVNDNHQLIGEKIQTDIFLVLDSLNKREYTGHSAIALVNSIIKYYPFHKELILNILDRDLKCRIASGLINKAFKNLIPEFSVALAESYYDKDRKARPINFEENYYCSHKLDGVRCIAIIQEDGAINFYSREGKEFLTLGVIKEELRKLGLRNVALDGEMCIVNPETGEETFQGIMKEIRRKDYTIKTPRYKLFDMIPLEEFYQKTSKDILSVRLRKLSQIIKPDNLYLDFVEQNLVHDKEHLEQLFFEANKMGWEGLIIRKDTIYSGKRCWDMLKLKESYDAEYKVISMGSGPIQYIKNGVKVTEDMLSEVTILHKGSEVGVGSGFSIEQRKFFHEHPEEIVGKTITVVYTQESMNQNGEPSLRFPRFKILHGNKREV